MSVSEREQAMLVHRERRMAIMIAAYAASSTKGANHDILETTKNKAITDTCLERGEKIPTVTDRNCKGGIHPLRLVACFRY